MEATAEEYNENLTVPDRHRSAVGQLLLTEWGSRDRRHTSLHWTVHTAV